MNIVERYDRKWYRLIACLTAIVALITVVYIVFNVVLMKSGSGLATNNPGLYWGFIYVIYALIGVMLIFTGIMLVVSAKIRSNKKLKDSLGSEMHRDSQNRATRNGFFVLMIMLGLLSTFESFYPTPNYPVFARIIFLLGVLSMLISWLYYNREVK